jgi:hypothetical protein
MQGWTGGLQMGAWPAMKKSYPGALQHGHGMRPSTSLCRRPEVSCSGASLLARPWFSISTARVQDERRYSLKRFSTSQRPRAARLC